MLCRMLLVAAVALPSLAQNYVERFTGEISRGQEFRKEISAGLELVLRPSETGWTISIIPNAKCSDNDDWASVVNAPYRGYNALHLDASYGISAQEAVGINPREFLYVMNCADYKQEARRLEVVMWPYNHTPKENAEALAKLATSARGRARLTILEAKTGPGRIESLKFRVDVAPLASKRRAPR